MSDGDEADDGEFRACMEFVSGLALIPDLLARVDPENRLLLSALSQVRSIFKFEKIHPGRKIDQRKRRRGEGDSYILLSA
jgi:hypothetical protein